MNTKRWKLATITAGVLAAALTAAGCSSQGSTGGSAEPKELKLAYVAWDSEIASTHVVEYVLEEKLGYEVELLQVDAGPMWTGVAGGSADAMVAAWLPSTHQTYYEENKSKIEDLGPNLDGTKIGLVVPSYMEISTIEDLKDAAVAESVDATIVGIEPGAGLMMATEKALDEYGLEGWTLLESSSAAMAAELQSAYEAQKPIIVTGWTPHWKFGKMDLKYLEDSKGVYGGDEQIHTIVRQGLGDDHPEAYKFLDQFVWTPEDMAAVMVDIQEGAEPAEAAAAWVNANADKVDAWLAGIE
ncbi:glycine betaine ABC transporter substrate-binding protein [Paenibacillus sp.]|uniref:glycine betaine ABC transporter substrate-binding protein n=1 Tax=Paenibacillus sp. TaxID=58172 RepID=UPI002D4F1BAE|nr:glycine betaine ABC transporter substrate-binding protein [Paenibacillus sp.]HZG84166.1 glycine betaine ABC transporter substrate-binding protein [Paenibacillus sp.]